MTLEDKVHASRLLALRRAEQLGNVTAACRELGISRSLFYRWKQRYERYGRDGLHPKRLETNRGRPHELSVQDEQVILATALSAPTRGPAFFALQLAQQGHRLSASTIYRHLRRVHWRVAFRRQYFTGRHQLEHSLQRFLHYYNNERPHQGYRTKGRLPAMLFWGLEYPAQMEA